MRKIEDECVGCPPEIGCFGLSCPNRNVERFYCDKCEQEEVLYEFDGRELCIDCIKEELTIVEGSND